MYVCMYVGCVGVVGCGRATFRVFMNVWYVCMYSCIIYVPSLGINQIMYHSSIMYTNSDSYM